MNEEVGAYLALQPGDIDRPSAHYPDRTGGDSRRIDEIDQDCLSQNSGPQRQTDPQTGGVSDLAGARNHDGPMGGHALALSERSSQIV